MPQVPYPQPTPPDCRESMGLSPAVLARRDGAKTEYWCPNQSNVEFDQYSDPTSPKTIYYNDVKKAYEILKGIIQPTPLMKSKCCEKFGADVYFKLETTNITGSFHDRSAIYVLHMLTPKQRRDGVYTASVGNWAMALAYQGYLEQVPVTVVLPRITTTSIVKQCKDFGATVVLHGKTLADAKKRAFKLIADRGHVGTYLNGYDHPHVIAAAGTIGMEILKQLPDTDAILVPIGGGGLIAGISTVIKHYKPDILIYGIEPGKSCCFSKALDNENPYKTEPEKSLALSLTVPKVGDNAFHTAQSLVDKMILIHDDWTARALLHLLEEESIVAEGAGAISLGALMCMPNILPELQRKKVVTIVSGGNIELWPLQRTIVHGKTVEGRVITIMVRTRLWMILSIRVPPGQEVIRSKILKVIESMRCNLTSYEVEHEWLEENKLLANCIIINCETKDYKQSCLLKKVIEKMFPNVCEFTSDIFKPKTICSCFPKVVY